MTPPKSARERDEDLALRASNDFHNRIFRTPDICSFYQGFIAGRESLRAEMEAVIRNNQKMRDALNYIGHGNGASNHAGWNARECLESLEKEE